MELKLIPSQFIDIALLEKNEGQVPGLPANPRILTEVNYEKLKKSIEDTTDMLSLRELLVYKYLGRYITIGGNMRLETLKRLGWEKVPCKVIEDAPVDFLRNVVLRDNSSYGEWDWDMLADEFTDEELAAAAISFPMDWELTEDGDEVEANEAVDDGFNEDEEQIEERVKRGDIWLLGEHRLMCGDSTSKEDVRKLMNGFEADLVVTDPPYNVAITNSQGMTIQNDNMDSKSFGFFLTKAFQAMEPVMRKGAAFYVWFASCEHINFETALNNAGLHVREELIWNKNSFNLGRQDYQHKYEPCLYGWKEGAAHYFFNSRKESDVIPDGEQLDIDGMKKDEMRDLLKKILKGSIATDVMDFNKPAKNEDHPTMKPVELFGYLVRNSSKRGERVLDVFGGSGTSIVVCEQLGRKCCAMELDEHYASVIVARWEKLTGKQAVKATI